MKRLFLLFIAFLPALCLSAQLGKNLSLGPRVGVNFAKFTSKDGIDNSESKPGLVAGLTSTYSINTNTGITFDALYSREGQSNSTFKTDLDYLRLMLAFNYFFRDQEDKFRPKIYVGPTLGFLLSAEDKLENGNDDIDVKETYNTIDIGLAVGLGFNYRVGGDTWLNVDGRFQPGLSNIIDNKPSGIDAIRNQNFQFSVGLAFGL